MEVLRTRIAALPGVYGSMSCDDRLIGGSSPPTTLHYASPDGPQEHPEQRLKTFNGILQTEAYGGYNLLSRLTTIPVP